MVDYSLQLTLRETLTSGYGDRVAIAADGQQWASAGSDKLFIWQDAALNMTIDHVSHHLHDLVFQANGAGIFVGPGYFDLGVSRWKKLPPMHMALVHGLANEWQIYAEQFELVASAWNPNGEELVVFGQYRPPRGIAVPDSYEGPHQRLLLLNGVDYSLLTVIWEGSDHQHFNALALSDWMIVAGSNPLEVWENASARKIATLDGHSASARRVLITDDNIISAGWDGRVIVWDTITWEPIHSWLAHEEFASAVAVYPNAPLIATGGGDRQVKFWHASEAIATITLDAPIEDIALSANRLIVATGGRRASLYIYDVRLTTPP